MLVLLNFKRVLLSGYFLFCREELRQLCLDIKCMRQISSLICIIKKLWSVSFNITHLDHTYYKNQLNNKKVLSWIQWKHLKECKQIWKKQYNSIFENVFEIFWIIFSLLYQDPFAHFSWKRHLSNTQCHHINYYLYYFMVSFADFNLSFCLILPKLT